MEFWETLTPGLILAIAIGVVIIVLCGLVYLIYHFVSWLMWHAEQTRIKRESQSLADCKMDMEIRHDGKNKGRLLLSELPIPKNAEITYIVRKVPRQDGSMYVFYTPAYKVLKLPSTKDGEKS